MRTKTNSLKLAPSAVWLLALSILNVPLAAPSIRAAAGPAPEGSPDSPRISTQPQSRIIVAGEDVTFSVEVVSSADSPSYQWRRNTVGIAGATNATLVLTNVILFQGGDYTVVAGNSAGSVTSDVAGLTVLRDSSVSASLGGKATLGVSHIGPAPASFQWQFQGVDIPGATTRRHSLENVQLIDVGQYSVVISNAAGRVTLLSPALVVDPTFTKITEGALVRDPGNFVAAAWGDLDNDGDLDVFLCNVGASDRLYRNDGNGQFTPLTEAEAGSDLLSFRSSTSYSGSWADYDNDGDLDLIVAGYSRGPVLYANEGNGRFTKAPDPFNQVLARATSIAGASWGDFDGDGWVDLFLARWSSGTTHDENYLIHNEGPGGFTRVMQGPVATARAPSVNGAWVDFDGDGDLDLFVPNSGVRNFLFENQGGGTFGTFTDPLPTRSPQRSWVGLWADFDNDGDLDVLVTASGQQTVLYANAGDGQLSLVPAEAFPSLPERASRGAAWGDYDNDGFIDLFIANEGSSNYLLRNRGDGSFEPIGTGSPANDGGLSVTPAWVDYNNDGFLDLFVSNGPRGGNTAAEKNFLYRNNGNQNHWVRIRPVGTSSNRDGMGAKVRVKASYAGAERWQMREITGGSSFLSSSPIEAHFGLREATNIDLVRIEWPSGIVQELRNVPVNQILTVTEPAQLQSTRPGEVEIRSWKEMSFGVEASTDLKQWIPAGTVTNLTGTLVFTDREPAGVRQQFYRVVAP